MTDAAAERQVLDPNVFASLMVELGEADAVLGGLTTFYPDTIRPALQIIRMEPGRTIASAVYVVVTGGTPYFLTDCAVNILPSAEQLAEIAAAAADVAEGFARTPRVAFISYSDFGSASGDEPARVRRAVEIFRALRPTIPADGEMQADTAVVSELIRRRRPGGPLDGAANVLVFPSLTAANAAYKLLNRLADAEVIGPILTGLRRSVHVLQRDAGVGDIVNLTAIAVADAQRKG
jgi:malate dehydrogenase (oxaloacetate-decarboxylating)(NADP+)